MAITVRRATAADVDIVCEFNRLLALESEDKTLDVAVLRAGCVAALADPAKGLYFLAEEDGVVLGQSALTYEWSDWRNGWFWWFQSVYVRQDARRRGVFRALCRHIEEAARQDPQVVGVRLYVERDNHVAQATYASIGLEKTTYLVMERYPLQPVS